MDALMLGPIAIPVASLVPLAALAAALAAARLFAWKRKRDCGPLLWKVVLAGLVAARLAFVAAHWDMYADAPWSMLKIGDGGLSPTAGLFAAFAVGAHGILAAPALRMPLMLSLAAGALAWIGTALATLDAHQAPMPLPPLALHRLDGTPVQISSLAGKPLVLNLWATWCPPCRREMPALRDAQARNPDLVFVFVNQGENAQAIKAYLAAEGLALGNVLLDPARRAGAAFKSSVMPTTLFFDSGGMLAGRRVGELSAATLDERLRQLRQPRAPAGAAPGP